MEVALLSLDIGSSGARASVFSRDGRLVAQSRCGYPTRYPHDGWAEQDAGQWTDAATKVLGRATGLATERNHIVAGMALTGQCPTYLPVDRAMRPLGPALTYQDNRSSLEAAELSATYGDATIHAFSGHVPQPFYILPKVLWHSRHDRALYESLYKVLQPSDYVAYQLTGRLVTSCTHACGTLAFDQTTRRWNEEFIVSAGLRENLFPADILDPWQIVGTINSTTAEQTGLPVGLPVVIGAPDSQCCCLGAGAIMDGSLSNMSGTSTCLNSTVPHMVGDKRVGNYIDVLPRRWSAELGLNTTGAALEWAARIILPHTLSKTRYQTIDKLARQSKTGANGVQFLPYLTDGERDNREVRGGFHNLSLRNDGADLMRAVMEGVAFAERMRIEILQEAGCGCTLMFISGGGARFDLWNEIKADVTGLPVYAITRVDAAELGAAMLAGIGTGVYADAAEAVKTCDVPVKEHQPNRRRVLQYEEGFQTFRALEQAFSRQEHPADTQARGLPDGSK